VRAERRAGSTGLPRYRRADDHRHTGTCRPRRP
jgi:hypothetical protein